MYGDCEKMIPQRSKKQKCDNEFSMHDNSITSNSDNTEDQKNAVIVLPPDLLQKLGINLGNIQSSNDCSPETNSDSYSKSKESNEFPKPETSELNVKSKCMHNKDNESSILETANLMKTSVFLSPTFGGLTPESNSNIPIDEITLKSFHNINCNDQNMHCIINDFKADNIKCLGETINKDEERTSRKEIELHTVKTSVPKQVDITVSVEASENVLDKHNKLITLPNNVMESEKKLSGEELEFESHEDLQNLKTLNKKVMTPATRDTIISVNYDTTEISESTSSDIDYQSQNHLSRQKKLSEPCNGTFEEGKYYTSSNNTNICVNTQLEGINIFRRCNIINVSDDVIKHGEVEQKNNDNNFGTHISAIVESQNSTVAQEYPKIQTIARKSSCDLYYPAIAEYKTDIGNNQNRPLSIQENKTEVTMYKTNTSEKLITKDIPSDSKHLNPIHKTVEYINETDRASSQVELPLGKVEEIAYYLSQHFYTDQSRENSSKNMNLLQTKANSKLCIQGVEKPGGYLKRVSHKRYLKTYSRGKRAKLSDTIRVISYEENVNTDIDCKINDNNLCVDTNILGNFCLCEDFGRFIQYDLDNSYEHIHFWERQEAQCAVEILFSIYEENNCEYKQNNTNNVIEEIHKENQCESSGTALNICWSYSENTNKSGSSDFISSCNQEIRNTNADEGSINKNGQSHYVNTDFNKYTSNCNISNEINESKVIDDTKMTRNKNGNKISNDKNTCNQNVDLDGSNAKKRKRREQTSESEPDCEKPSAKKYLDAVRCDMCNSKVPKNEWDDHVSKEYCFVTWIEGQKLDLKNEELLRKLNKKLRDTNKLKCIFCKFEICEVKKFIKHVRKCKKKKFQFPENNTDFTKKHSENVLEHEKIQVIEDEPVIIKKANVMTLPELKVSEAIQDVEETVLQVKAIAKPEVSGLQVEIEEKQITLKKTRRKSVPVQVDSVDQLVFEVPVLQVDKEKKQIDKVPLSRVQTADKQVSEVPVSQGTGDKVETEDSDVTCGVCKKVVRNSLWIEHISREHNYIAWRDDDLPLDCADEGMIRDYLNYTIKEIGELVCKECGLKRKFAKSFLKHIKLCQYTEQINIESEKVVKTEKVENNIKCGVCQLEVMDAQWLDHIYNEHDYLAWKEGEPDVDFNDNQQLYEHLFHLTKLNDGLNCKKCGCRRRYVKSYLKHIEKCDGETPSAHNQTLNDSDNTTADGTLLDMSDDEDGNVNCGVCEMEVEGKDWLNHIQKYHSYLAWKKGNPALNLNDNLEVYNYLHALSKKYNGLRCNKCGASRKYVKSYLSHMESCETKLVEATVVDKVPIQDSYECGVCAEVVDAIDWKSHAMKKHYNIAWVVGDYPIDVKNVPTVEKYLKEYREIYGTLKCRTCGASRASLMGFYAHIIQCGKTDEEVDPFKLYCDICDNKYLCIYKYQHAAMHREQEYSKERKLVKEAQEREILESIKSEPLSDRRRAAEKARQFIEKAETFEFNCDSCGYGADDQIELEEHVCKKVKHTDFSDSENSAHLESSGEDSADTVVDSNLSEEEDMKTEKRRRRHGDTSSAASRVPRVPFTAKCAKSYLKQSADDYREKFLTNGVLYPQWGTGNIELLSGDETANYLPILKESCKVIVGKDEPEIFTQFEVKKQNGTSIFVGGCVQCISWAPPHIDDCDDEFGHFLAVACHNNVDTPRLDCAKTYKHSGLLQIWDLGDLNNTSPKFGLGIAHDYGTIWAIEWCPSGVREAWRPSESLGGMPESNTNAFLRLGLLAIACSNGSAYILSIPYPSSVKTKDKPVCKLTPVAELRLSRGERDVYQATSISWSAQNGHATVMVGYSDGTIALYNLKGDSPLLMDTEGGLNIFYPFQDERPHNSSIADVKTFPSSSGAGLICSSSPTGSEMAHVRGVARVHGHLSSTSSVFVPHWPSLMVTGNESIVNQSVNELDWWGVGRRTGGVQKGCGCLHCGILAMYTPPLLKTMTTHPVYCEFNKEPIAVCQMTPIAKKRPKHKNDELQMTLEPLSYSDAVKMYALDFKLVKDLDKESLKQINMQMERYPERFPLNDIPSMAFCPSPQHHKKLAVATHAGIIFIVTV